VTNYPKEPKPEQPPAIYGYRKDKNGEKVPMTQEEAEIMPDITYDEWLARYRKKVAEHNARVKLLRERKISQVKDLTKE
jgi:hypothetical protein